VVLLVVPTTGNKRRVVRAKVSKVLLQGNLPQVAIRERAKCLGNGNSPRITDHGLQKLKWVKAAGRGHSTVNRRNHKRYLSHCAQIKSCSQIRWVSSRDTRWDL